MLPWDEMETCLKIKCFVKIIKCFVKIKYCFPILIAAAKLQQGLNPNDTSCAAASSRDNHLYLYV